MWQKMICIAEMSGLILEGPNKGKFQKLNPKVGEIVHCCQCDCYDDCYTVQEYLYGIDNIKRSFMKRYFAPIEEIGESFIEEFVEPCLSTN